MIPAILLCDPASPTFIVKVSSVVAVIAVKIPASGSVGLGYGCIVACLS